MTLHEELRAEVALLRRAVDLSPKIEEDDERTDAHYEQGRGDKAAEELLSLSASLARHPEAGVSTWRHVNQGCSVEPILDDQESPFDPGLFNKWLRASLSARTAEHHFPADCLAEAADTYKRLCAMLDADQLQLQAPVGEPLEKPTVVCLCGSTRFYDEFQEANYRLTMDGEIVLSVGFYPHAKAEAGHGEGVGHDSAEKIALDELHKRKIDLADYVYVINPGGYIGESTASEIDYAYKRGKRVEYQVEPDCAHDDLQCPPGPCDRFYPPVVDRGRDG